MKKKEKLNELFRILNINNNSFDERLLLQKVREKNFSNNILSYSSKIAYNYIPYFIESIGCTPSKFRNKPLKSEKYYVYLGESLSQIEKIEYRGNYIIRTDFIIEEDDIREIISVDSSNELIQYFRIKFQDEKIVSSYQFNDEENSSETIYFYQDRELITSLSSMLLNGMKMEIEKKYQYDEHGNIKSIYSIVNGCDQGYLFQK